MRTKLVLATLLLGCAAIGTAQQDSVDVFPLAINNSWGYRFFNSYYTGLGGYGEIDTGFAACTIVASLPSIDTTRWQITRRRDFLRQEWHNGVPQPPYPLQDSSTFEIVELSVNAHQIYLPTSSWTFQTTVFPFWRLPSPDTTRFYRYASVDSTGFLEASTYFGGLETITRNLIFQRDIGVVQSMGYVSRVNGSTWRWRYYLEQFTVHVPDIQGPAIPTRHILNQNYPNPFNPSTTITYDLPTSSHVTLKVFDILGREVATLVDGEESAGTKSVSLNAQNMASGVYLYRLQARSFVDIKKLILLK